MLPLFSQIDYFIECTQVPINILTPYFLTIFNLNFELHGRIQRGWGAGQVVGTPHGKSQSYIGFLSNTGRYPPENHKATKPAFNVGGPSLVSQQNDILMVFRWRANDGYLDPQSPHQLQKKKRQC